MTVSMTERFRYDRRWWLPGEERCGCVLDGSRRAYLNVDVNVGEPVTQRMPIRLHRFLAPLFPFLGGHLELVE